MRVTLHGHPAGVRPTDKGIRYALFVPGTSEAAPEVVELYSKIACPELDKVDMLTEHIVEADVGVMSKDARSWMSVRLLRYVGAARSANGKPEGTPASPPKTTQRA